MGVNENIQEKYVDREEKMVKDRTWTNNIRLNGTHRRCKKRGRRLTRKKNCLQDKNLRIILSDFHSFSLPSCPSANSVGSAFRIYPESDHSPHPTPCQSHLDLLCSNRIFSMNSVLLSFPHPAVSCQTNPFIKQMRLSFFCSEVSSGLPCHSE